MSKMRLIFISDTHSYHKKIELTNCDLLVCSGDISWKGERDILESFDRWIGKLKQKGIIREAVVIPGNHDLSGDSKFIRYYQPSFREFFKHCTLLVDQSFDFEGLKIYASPKTPKFGNWAYAYERGLEAKHTWSQIPDDTQLLVTHGPPHSILDQTYYGGENVGCEELYKRVKQLDQLIIHSFGHIHEAFGVEEVGGVHFINASTCTLQYNPTNSPVVVDLVKINDKWKVDSYFYYSAD